MRTVIIGGSFNPVHIGHLYLFQEILNQLDYRRVLFIPVSLPSHKKADTNTKPMHRLNMLESVIPRDGAVVDQCEIERGGVSYSIDTVRSIMERYEITGKPGLVIGDDLVKGFPGWKNADELSEAVELVVVHRNSADKMHFGYPHRYINNLMLPVSSSDIRNRVKEGRVFRYLVPESVYEYINVNKLYRD